eukprot:scaffold83297_cov51-Prasinocladus_malaysianus.AAC.1
MHRTKLPPEAQANLFTHWEFDTMKMMGEYEMDTTSNGNNLQVGSIHQAVQTIPYIDSPAKHPVAPVVTATTADLWDGPVPAVLMSSGSCATARRRCRMARATLRAKDPEGRPLTVSVINLPRHGVLRAGSSGLPVAAGDQFAANTALMYMYGGDDIMGFMSDSFEYTATNDLGESSQAEVRFVKSQMHAMKMDSNHIEMAAFENSDNLMQLGGFSTAGEQMQVSVSKLPARGKLFQMIFEDTVEANGIAQLEFKKGAEITGIAQIVTARSGIAFYQAPQDMTELLELDYFQISHTHMVPLTKYKPCKAILDVLIIRILAKICPQCQVMLSIPELRTGCTMQGSIMLINVTVNVFAVDDPPTVEDTRARGQSCVQASAPESKLSSFVSRDAQVTVAPDVMSSIKLAYTDEENTKLIMKLMDFPEHGKLSRSDGVPLTGVVYPTTTQYAYRIPDYSDEWGPAWSAQVTPRWSQCDCCLKQATCSLFGGPATQEECRCDYLDFSLHQLLGAPDSYPTMGTQTTGWGPYALGENFVVVELEHPVYVSAIKIYEVFLPGKITRIRVAANYQGNKTNWEELYHGLVQDLPKESTQIFAPHLCPASEIAVRYIRLDFVLADDLFYIMDAVEVLGTLSPTASETLPNHVVNYTPPNGIHGALAPISYFAEDCSARSARVELPICSFAVHCPVP